VLKKDVKMNFSYKITVPKETEKDAPEKLMMPLDYGIITHVLIIIPDGQKETTHIRIKYHEAQLYPLNRAEWYQGDGSEIEFDDRFPFIVEPYELKCEGYNTSTLHDHGIILNFNVLRPEELGWSEIPSESMARLYALLGTDLEV